jgi:REP element-mobilizing transposase RayT
LGGSKPRQNGVWARRRAHPAYFRPDSQGVPPFKLLLSGDFDVHTPQTRIWVTRTLIARRWGLKHLQETRQIHFLTFSCYKRRQSLRTLTACASFEFALERVRKHYEICVYGYVVMPEHVRLLIREPERSMLAQAIKSLKRGVARKLALRAANSFWLARCYDFDVWGATFIAIRWRGDWSHVSKTGLGAASGVISTAKKERSRSSRSGQRGNGKT